MGNENISSTTYTLKEITDPEKTYVKSNQLNKRQNVRIKQINGTYSSTETVKYHINKTPGQSNYKTAYYKGQRIGNNILKGAEFINTTIEIIKAMIFKK